MVGLHKQPNHLVIIPKDGVQMHHNITMVGELTLELNKVFEKTFGILR
jgi:hypothetical protein